MLFSSQTIVQTNTITITRYVFRYNYGLLPRENPALVMKKLNAEATKLLEEKASIEKELESLRLKAGITLSSTDDSSK